MNHSLIVSTASDRSDIPPAAEPLERVVIFGMFGPPTLAFARTCAHNGIEAYLLERIEGGAGAPCYSSALAEQQAIPKSMGRDDDTIEAIKSYCESVAAQALITVSEDDLLWLAEHRYRFEPEVRLLAASAACLRKLQSKKDQIELARRAGFDVLPTWYLQSPDDAATVPCDQYPICLRPGKPSDVTPSFKARIFYSPEALRSALQGLTRIDGPIIAQPFLRLPDLKVHGARAECGRVLAMRPFLVERKFEGVTLTLSQTSFPPGIEDACRKFAGLAGITGGFHFDLLFDSTVNKAYFLEINIRMGGITDKAKAFGYDQPALIIDCFGFGRSAWKPPTPTRRRRVVTKRSVVKHMLVVARGRHSELDYPQVSRLRHLLMSCRDLLTARDSVFDWDDLKGTARFNLQ